MRVLWPFKKKVIARQKRKRISISEILDRDNSVFLSRPLHTDMALRIPRDKGRRCRPAAQLEGQQKDSSINTQASHLHVPVQFRRR